MKNSNSNLSAQVQRIKQAMDRSGYVLMMTTPLMLRQGIFSVDNGTVAGERRLSHDTMLSSQSAMVLHLTPHQQRTVKQLLLWNKVKSFCQK